MTIPLSPRDPCGASVEEGSIMFGIGSHKRRGRSDTFAPSRIGGAALAGLGMLAWKWWRNRQASGRPTTPNPDRPFTESSNPSSGVY